LVTQTNEPTPLEASAITRWQPLVTSSSTLPFLSSCPFSPAALLAFIKPSPALSVADAQHWFWLSHAAACVRQHAPPGDVNRGFCDRAAAAAAAAAIDASMLNIGG
jgi:hypothetical protein